MYMKLFKFRFLVNKCIKLCEGKIKNEQKNDECTSEQIRSVILPEMMKLKSIGKSTDLPSADKRFIDSYACAFKTWGWDMKNPSALFRIIAKINDEYKKL